MINQNRLVQLLPLILSPNNDEESRYMAQFPNASAVCILMYAMVCTGHDIS